MFVRRLDSLPPWTPERGEQMVVLEGISELGDAEERQLTMLRLVRHTRELLLANIGFVEAQEAEAVAALRRGDEL